MWRVRYGLKSSPEKRLPLAARNSNALLMLTLLSGCAQPALRAGADHPAQVTQSINLAGFPPEYKRGFTAGCESASDSGSVRPKGAGSFVQGWQDGLDYCSPRKSR
jgi:hypothetical protein